MKFTDSAGRVIGDVDFNEPELNLLAHAQAIELEIGSACGGHGVCGGDRVRLTPEANAQCSPITSAEREHLTDAEIASGIRLACQCWPNTLAELTVTTLR